MTLRNALNEELIRAVADILNDWNPLGERASSVNGLDGYYVEAMDVLSSLDSYKQSVRRTVGAVLSDAFEIELDEGKLRQYSERIEQLIKKHQ